MLASLFNRVRNRVAFTSLVLVDDDQVGFVWSIRPFFNRHDHCRAVFNDPERRKM
jgi:hypothetical protein